MIGKVVTGFTILHKLGEGGMAEVWYAENKIKKPAAIKILKDEFTKMPEVVKRFENEATTMVALSHTNIRQVYDYELVDNRPCIIMEYLEGSDLKHRLNNGEKFSDAELQNWWNQCVDVLNYTHKQGIVHRDIKPSNIFITTDNKVKILDFGIAKLMDNVTMTQTGTRMGTLLYMSPEQVKDSKHIDSKTDVYSLAVTFYHLLTGVAPYDSDTSSAFEIQMKIVTEELDLSALPKHWHLILLPYLHKNAQERAELLHFNQNDTSAIRCFREKETIIDSVPFQEKEKKKKEEKPLESAGKQPEKPIDRKKKNKWLLPILGIIAICLIALLIVLNTGGKSRKSNSENIDKPESPYANIVDEIENNMVFISGGTFIMGSPESEPERFDWETQHKVTVNDFKMSKYEVTFDQYDAYCEATGAEKPDDFGLGRGSLPVINVSWDDANDFCNWLSQKTGKTYRLPTEAEWEYACRAGTSTPFYTGNTISTSQANYNFPNNGNAKYEDFHKTLPVGSFMPNAWGLYDMNGNVSEWCSDWYDEYSTMAQINPQGPSLGMFRVCRGGSWNGAAFSCRSAYRGNIFPEHRNYDLGFRIVSPKENEEQAANQNNIANQQNSNTSAQNNTNSNINNSSNTSPNSKKLKIGDTHAGGIIFYLDETGQHGLVCAPYDQSAGAEWGCYKTAKGGTATYIGSGQYNTQQIVNTCSQSGIAARICNNLVLDGYTDWFLPSKDELSLMHKNLKQKGLGNFRSGWYWSSSEYAGLETGGAWGQIFSGGYQDYYAKNGPNYVRAVRAF